MRYLIFLYVLIVALGQSSKAENLTEENGFSYINYTTRDGLPSNEIYCVFEDSYGYIWIGTDRGVVRFDGYEFEVFTTEDGLSDNVIFAITEDQYGTVWFSPANLKLCYFKQDKFFEFENSDIISNCVNDVFGISSMHFDKIKINENEIILGSANFGYIKVLLDTRWVENCLIDIKNNLNQNDLTLIKERELSLVAKLLKNPKSNRFNLIFNDLYVEIELLGEYDDRGYFAHNDTLWNLYFGRNQIMQSKKDLKIIKTGFSTRCYAINNKYLFNTFDSFNDGNVYLSKFSDVNVKKDLLIDKKIRLTPSCIDKNGGIWLGSLKQGIFYIPNLGIRNIDTEFNTTAIMPVKEGLLFVSKKKTAFILTDRGQKLVSTLKLSDFIGAGCNNVINFYNPVVFTEVKDWVKENYSHLSSFGIGSIKIESDSLILSLGTKLFQFKEYYGFKKLVPHFANNKVYSMEIVKNDTILCTKDGLKKINSRGLSPFLLDDQNFAKRAQDIKYLPSKDLLIIGTIGNGIYIFKNKKLIKRFTSKDGLMSNCVNHLYKENENRIWIATNRGVNYLEIAQNLDIQLKSLFSASKNLLSPNIQQIYLHHDSLLYLGTDKGINEININKIINRKHSNIPIKLTSIKINDVDFSLEYLNDRELEYNHNNISIGFNGIAFNKFGNLRYRYKLLGLSENWIYTTSTRALFSQLPAGTFEFVIEVENENGDWLNCEKELKFKVKRPYWQLPLFYLSLFSLVVIIISASLYYYISNLKREKKLLENQKKMAEELNESRQKALNSQLNPHFVFNSLNSIQNFILTQKTELSSDYLSLFSKLMRFVFENSKKLFVPLTDEIEALNLYISLERLRHNKEFDYHIEVDELIQNQMYIPSLLVQPIIENAIWHGLLPKISNDKQLDICFKQVEDKLVIEVRDNGVGRSFLLNKPKVKLIKKQKSSGVELTKQRIQLLQEFTGIKCSFAVEDLLNSEGEPIGTAVTIIIPDNLSTFD